MPRVLIVEDMALIAMSVQDMLEELGYEVVGIAGSVEAALHQLDVIDPSPDAVLLDADLRGYSSRPVAEKLRRHHIPFAVSSGYGAEKLGEVVQHEPTLPKPIEETRLRQILADLTVPRP